MADGLALSAAAWLATVALHGVLIVVLIALSTRRMRSGLVRERAWKLALVGALVTATAQLGLGVDPIGGAVALSERPAQPRNDGLAALVEPLAAPHAQHEGLISGATALEVGRTPEHAARSTARAREPGLPFVAVTLEPLPIVEPMRARDAASRDPLELLSSAVTGLATSLDLGALEAVRLALAAWAAIAAVGLAFWSLRWRRLARQLADRRPLGNGPRRALDELCRRAGWTRPVQLSVSTRLAAPITFGFLRAEVCLPERALIELGLDEQRAMLAHELAHVVRRDPLWLALAGLIERVLFFQPLARLARRRWQEEAELACDDLAVRWTGERLSLATCLTEVAGWLLHEPRALAGLPVPSMALAAHGRAGLGRRVRRLLDEPATGERVSRWIAPVCVLGLASVVAAAPRIAPSARAVDAPQHSMRQLALHALERAAEHVDRLPAQHALGSSPSNGPDPFDAPLAERPDEWSSATPLSATDFVAEHDRAFESDELASLPAELALEAQGWFEPFERPEPPQPADVRERASSDVAAAAEALQVIGPHGQADVVFATPEPGLDDLMFALERSIALLQRELDAIADEAEARSLDGWREPVERLERRIDRLAQQRERLAASAAMLVEPVATPARFTFPTTIAPFGVHAKTMNGDEVNR